MSTNRMIHYRVTFSRTQNWTLDVDVSTDEQHPSIAAINQGRRLVDVGVEPTDDEGLAVVDVEKVEPSGL